MPDNLKFTCGKVKGGVQEIQGIQVSKVGDDYNFNFQTSRDPEVQHIEILKAFRNNFILELRKANHFLLDIDK